MSTSLSGSSDIDAVRDATDLVRLIGEHVALRPRGREHVGLCPFHEDRRPSLAVVTHKGDGFYNCFACGASGDCFRFVMDYHKMDFAEALRYLADQAGITLTPWGRAAGAPGGSGQAGAAGAGPNRAEIRKAVAFALEFFQRTLGDPEQGAAAREVIERRGISPAMVEQFMIGCAPRSRDTFRRRLGAKPSSLLTAVAAGLVRRRADRDPTADADDCYDTFRHRLIFPIFDDLGRPIAFGGRAIDPDDQPKYLNSPENALFHKSRTLYGLHLAKRSIIEARQAIVVEGYTDVIACHQGSITNAVGTLGTALTTEHAAVLTRLCDTVVLVFDGDEAGRKAADRGVEVFFREQVDVRICVLPDGLDPDDLLKQERGDERFRLAVEGAKDALEYKLDRFQAGLGGSPGLSARQRHLEAFLQELADLGFGALQGVRKRLVIGRLADLLGVSIADIESAIPRSSRRGPAGRIAPAGASSADPSSDPRLIPADGSTSPPGDSSQETGSLLSADAALNHVTRARRIAEQELLAILLFDSSAGLEPVVRIVDGMEAEGCEGDEVRAITTMFGTADFADPHCGRIAEIVMAWLEEGHAFSMQHVLARIDDEGTRKTAATLFREGQRRCEEEGASPRRELAVAADGLHRVSLREGYQQQVAAHRSTRGVDSGHPAPPVSIIEEPEGESVAVSDAGVDHAIGDVVLEGIRKRRQQGVLPGAISQGVRS